MLKLVPTGHWSDNAVDSKRNCWDGNLGEVRVHCVLGFCEQKVKPIDVDVQTVGVNAIFGYVTEQFARLALCTWAYIVVVTFRQFFAVT